MPHVLAAVILLVVAVVSPLRAAETLTLVTLAGPPYTRGTAPGFLDLLLGEAFGRLGLAVDVQRLSGGRALMNANAGIDDGDAMRVAGIEAAYPNLIRVPEEVVDLEIVAFARHARPPLEGWSSLAEDTVGILTGRRVLERALAAHPRVIRVREARQLFGLLARGRADVVMFDRWQGLWLAQQESVATVALAPPLSREPMYVYLHKRHADLVPTLAAALAAMRADGSYARIFAATLGVLAR